jgi:hypothetical protein
MDRGRKGRCSGDCQVTMDGFQKSAQRLSIASSEDRAWVLSMLETEDRIRLIAAMRDMHSPEQRSDGGDDVLPPAQPTSEKHVNLPAKGVSDWLSSADGQSIRMLLSEQPDWVSALLVAEARWPWVEDYLAGLDAGKLLRLETLVRRVNATVRPRVRAVVVEVVSNWLSTNEHRPLQESAFDVLLARLRQKEPAATIPTGLSV